MPPANVAETLFALDIVTVQVRPVPVHAPPHPLKVAPGEGVAVSVTDVPGLWLLLQSDAPLPQLIPPPVTLPFPVTTTLSANPVAPPGPVPPVKVAVTVFAALIRTVQVVAVPPQAPVQPAKIAPVVGVATRVTVAFCAKAPEQTVAPLPQLIAPIPPVTPPLPVTVTVNGSPAVKVAVTVRATSIVRVQVVPVPVQELVPVQPVKAKPSLGVAVSVTVEPAGSTAEHVAGPEQSIPRPSTLPVPAIVTVKLFVPALASVQLAFTLLFPSSSTVQATLDPLQSPPQPLKTLPDPATVEKLAVTLCALDMVTVHVGVDPDAEQAPPQPVKVAPVSGVAVSKTFVPDVSFTEQVEPPEPQLIPPPATVPSPVTCTLSTNIPETGAGGAPGPTVVTTAEDPGVSKTVNVEPVRAAHWQSEPAGAEPQSTSVPAWGGLRAADVPTAGVGDGQGAQRRRRAGEVGSDPIARRAL